MNARLRILTSASLLLAGALLIAPGARAQEDDERMEQRGTIYDSEGRRDPFRPTIGADKGSGDRCASRQGLAAVLLQEVKLTGITMTARGPMAMWEGGPSNQGYFAYVGDEFCDGTVHEIDFTNKVVIVRQMKEDPNRKLLKPWIDVPRHLYPEEATAAAPVRGAGSLTQGSSRRGPGNIARPNTAAKPGSTISHRQGR